MQDFMGSLITRCSAVGLLSWLASAEIACGHSHGDDPFDAAVDTPGAGSAQDAREVDARVEMGSDAGSDAGNDAAIDASLGPSFDVAYVNEIHVPSNVGTFKGLILIINKGPGAISLDGITVVSFADDSPAADWLFTKRLDESVKLPPGEAAGDLTAASAAQIVDSGLAREPISSRSLDFEMSFVFNPAPGIKFHARAVLQLESQRVTLPFQFFVTPSGAVETISAARVASKP